MLFCERHCAILEKIFGFDWRYEIASCLRALPELLRSASLRARFSQAKAKNPKLDTQK
jgi:hypothetical protein